ncbi:DUF4232 domain-containing protein [Streptomyces sp. NPDC093094]|uniref:DUF4232 domain-containing protein n=1 Tax=Streptomyces sp. NPDC093094 TaxID=3366026 RepID=UPI0038147768
MPTSLRAAPAVPSLLAGALLLTGCGSDAASPGDAAARVRDTGGAPHAQPLCPADVPQYGSLPPADGAAPAHSPSGTPSPLPLPPSGGQGEDGVRVTGLYAWGPDSGCGTGVSAGIEVTNDGGEAAAYTVTLGFTAETGGDNVDHVVAPVAPGATVTRAVALGSASHVSDVRIVKVRSVPAAETPSASGPCPPSGVHVYADQGDAAMGLRAVGLHLVNCGTRPYPIEGYPRLELLDEDHEPVDGVRILDGTGRIGTGLGGDDAPRPVVLRPGEAAVSSLAWRNTTEFGDPVNAPYVRLWAKPGAAPVTVVPELDLGTTGQLGVAPWRKDEQRSGLGG